MTQKIVNARITLKHDTEENWTKAVGFIPRASEPIVYDEDDTHPYKRFKIGDGERNVNDLPFINDIITNDEIDEICSGTLTTFLEDIACEEASF
jgi:hypothetical protein